MTAVAPAPVQSIVLAHRSPEGPRIEPGEHIQSGCSRERGGRVKAIHIYSGAGHCIRVEPRDRLLFVNSTDIGQDPREGNEVVVTLGGYEARIGPGQSALFPAPAGPYLALGLHRTNTHADAPAPLVMVLPEGCAIPNHGLPRGPPLAPGEGLCFVEGAPPCRARSWRCAWPAPASRPEPSTKPSRSSTARTRPAQSLASRACWRLTPTAGRSGRRRSRPRS